MLAALAAGALRDAEALPSFVYQTARRVCLQRRRQLGRRRRAIARLAAEPGSPPGDALAVLLREERRARVMTALAGLSEADREVLRLFFNEGLSAEEVAARTATTAGAARVRKHRALRRLETILGGEDL